MTHVLSRQQLYDLVWAEPKTKVARKLSVSDVALGKACVKLQVPMPARGYWAKLAAGKKLEPTPLPRRGLGKSDEIRIGGNRYGYYDRSEELEKELPPEPVFDGDEADVHARATASLTTKFLPKTLAAAHPFVSRLLAEDEARKKDVLENRWSSAKPLFAAPVARRRLKIISALFTILDRSGYRVSLSGSEADDLAVIVGDTRVNLRVDWKGRVSERDRRGMPAPAPPKAPLKISVIGWTGPHVERQWEDAPDQPLESRLREIAIELIVQGEMNYRENVLWCHEHLVRRKQEAEEEKLRIREEAELAARKEQERQLRRQERWLVGQSTNLQRARDIRELVEVLGAHPEVASKRAVFEAWKSWALDHAARIDPLCQPIDGLLFPTKS